MIRFTNPGTGDRVDMLIQASRIELSARRPALRFTGDWGISADADARFFGQCTFGDDTAPMRASLSLVAGDDALTVVLRAVDGRVVMGPATLRRVGTEARFTRP